MRKWIKDLIEKLTPDPEDFEPVRTLLGKVRDLEAALKVKAQVIEEYRAANTELLTKIQQLQKKIAGMETDCRMAINALTHAVDEEELCLLGPRTIEEAATIFSNSCESKDPTPTETQPENPTPQ